MRAFAAAIAMSVLSATAVTAAGANPAADVKPATAINPGAAKDQGAAAKKPADQQDVVLPNAVDLNQLADANTLVSKVSAVIGRFRSDPKMLDLMRRAKGVFVIPEFGHGTQIPSGRWGAGVMLVNANGHWSEPVFYGLGGGSLGQTNANGGALVLYIMNDRAMAKFRSASNWSLTPQTGLNTVTYSAAMPQDLSGGGADIVAWSAAGGPHSDTQVSVTDISLDTASNQAVYGTTDTRNILANNTLYINPAVINLARSMPSSASTGIAQNHQTSGHG